MGLYTSDDTQYSVFKLCIKFQSVKNSFHFPGNQRVLLVCKKPVDTDSQAKDKATEPEQSTEPLVECNENSPASTGDSLIISSDPPSSVSSTLTENGMYYSM